MVEEMRVHIHRSCHQHHIVHGYAIVKHHDDPQSGPTVLPMPVLSSFREDYLYITMLKRLNMLLQHLSALLSTKRFGL